jgi:hypothetical protein
MRLEAVAGRVGAEVDMGIFDFRISIFDFRLGELDGEF